MGRYFNWEKTVPSDKLMTDVVLINHLTSLGFNHIVKVTEQLDIGETLKNHPEITDFTNEEWSGFFITRPIFIIYFLRMKMMQWQQNYGGHDAL